MLERRVAVLMLFVGSLTASAHAQAITSVSLTPNHASPQLLGTAITWTAVPSGGIAPFTYKWWQFDGTAWTLLRDWSTSNVLTWTPAHAGSNWRVGVWVRNAGNTGEGVCDAFHYCASVEFSIVSTCAYALNPPSVNVGAEGGGGIVSVSTMAGCAWTPNSNASWLSPDNSSLRYGSGTMTWSATPNIDTGGSRQGGILIGNLYFDVFQCEQVVVPRTIALPAGSGTTAVDVVSSGSCPWTATAPQGSFAAIASGATGVSYGPVTIAYAANPTIQPRTTMVTVAGQPVTLTQAGAACMYTLDPASVNVGAAGGSGSVAISAPAGCGWAPNSNATWLTPGNTSQQQGPGTTTWSAAPNINTGGSRHGGILIGDRYFNVFQCEQVVSPATITLPAGSGTTTVHVVSSGWCPWTAAAPHGSFATITGGATGTGQGPVAIAYAANPTTQPRTTVITVAGRPVTLTQAGAPCTYAFDPAWARVGKDGGSGSFQVVATPSDCTWTVTGGAAWLTVTAGSIHQGTGAVSWTAAPNLSGYDRDAVVAVGNQGWTRSFQLTQAAGADITCEYSVTPSTLRLGHESQTATLIVSTRAGCSWTASTQAPFLHVMNGTSGAGLGSVTLSVDNNTNEVPRVASVMVGGQRITVIQASFTGVTCDYAVHPGEIDFQAAGGTATIGITPNFPQCPWTIETDRNWIHVASGNAGTGSGVTIVDVEHNPTPDVRNGRLFIGTTEAYIEVDRDRASSDPGVGGSLCEISVSPTSLDFQASGGTILLQVDGEAACRWTIGNLPGWLTSDPLAGQGPGAVALTASPNGGAATRSTLVLVNDSGVVVTQPGTGDPSGCVFAVSVSPDTNPATGRLHVTGPATCGWTANTTVPWITLGQTAGTGSGEVAYALDASSMHQSSVGQIDIAGETITWAGPALVVPVLVCISIPVPCGFDPEFGWDFCSIQLCQRYQPIPPAPTPTPPVLQMFPPGNPIRGEVNRTRNLGGQFV